MAKLKTRKLTGRAAWPLVLLEGEESAGKSYASAVLCGSERVGDSYWMDLGEGNVDEYAVLANHRIQPIDHDGTYRDILEQTEAVYDIAQRAARKSEPPTVFVFDSMTLLWGMLKSWTYERARQSNYGQSVLKNDPNAEIKAGNGLWNDANERHERVMRLLMTFPGIVVMTARGKEVSAVDDDGRPIAKQKTWRVESQKFLAYNATVWVRMYRDPRRAEVIGSKSLRLTLPDGKPLPVEDFTVEKLVFDMLGCDPKQTQPRDMRELQADAAQPFIKRTGACTTVDELKALWAETDGAGLTPEERGWVSAAVTAKLAEIRGNGDDSEEIRAAAARRSAKTAKAGKAAKAAKATEPAQADETPAADEAAEEVAS